MFFSPVNVVVQNYKCTYFFGANWTNEIAMFEDLVCSEICIPGLQWKLTFISYIHSMFHFCSETSELRLHNCVCVECQPFFLEQAYKCVSFCIWRKSSRWCEVYTNALYFSPLHYGNVVILICRHDTSIIYLAIPFCVFQKMLGLQQFFLLTSWYISVTQQFNILQCSGEQVVFVLNSYRKTRCTLTAAFYMKALSPCIWTYILLIQNVHISVLFV